MIKEFLTPFYCLLISFVISGIDCKKSTGTGPEETEDEIQPGELYVDIYDSQKACNGTTLFTDSHDTQNLQVVEVDMDGTILWEFTIPQSWIQDQPVGLDAELLDNGNILLVISGSGLYEINRNGNIIWQLQDPNCSHDADRLPNGNNHLLICLQWETPYQVVEIDRTTGQPVWEYYRDNLRTARDSDRLPNGNTLIVGVLEDTEDSVIFEVTSQGEVVWQLKIKDVPTKNTNPGWFYKAQRIPQGS